MSVPKVTRVAARLVVVLALALPVLAAASPIAIAGPVPVTGRALPDAGTFDVSLIALLTGVAATSPRQAWAVRGLRPADGSLQGVAAVSADDAWAVGFSHGTLIMHWTGARWRQANGPDTGAGSKLLGVVATSAHDAWSVGCVSCLTGGGSKPLALRWNGSSWRRVRLPGTASGSKLLGVAAVSARDAWAVGCVHCGDASSKPLIMRWNGRRWHRARLPVTPSSSQHADKRTAVFAVARAGGPFPRPSTDRALEWQDLKDLRLGQAS